MCWAIIYLNNDGENGIYPHSPGSVLFPSIRWYSKTVQSHRLRPRPLGSLTLSGMWHRQVCVRHPSDVAPAWRAETGVVDDSVTRGGGVRDDNTIIIVVVDHDDVIIIVIDDDNVGSVESEQAQSLTGRLLISTRARLPARMYLQRQRIPRASVQRSHCCRPPGQYGGLVPSLLRPGEHDLLLCQPHRALMAVALAV